MTVAAIRDEVAERLVASVWGQWSQMGVAARPPAGPETRAADPEALLVATLAVEDLDPRLVGEVKEWAYLNRGLISVQRLANLGRDTLSTPDTSSKSQAPDLRTPINLAFRLRSLFGLGARAEVMRTLLTVDAPRVSVGLINAEAGFADRNVRDALGKLTAAGAIHLTVVGGTRFYHPDHATWAGWHGAKHFEWIAAFRSVALIRAWLSQPERETASEYLLGSDARVLVGQLEADFRYIGIAADRPERHGADYWATFVELVRALLTAIEGS